MFKLYKKYKIFNDEPRIIKQFSQTNKKFKHEKNINFKTLNKFT